MQKTNTTTTIMTNKPAITSSEEPFSNETAATSVSFGVPAPQLILPGDISTWPLLAMNAPNEVLRSVRFWTQFGQRGYAITANDHVFYLGPSVMENDAIVCQEVRALRGRGVIRLGQSSEITTFYYALTEGGYLWMWGVNVDGQLGLGDNTPRVTPKLVRSLAGSIEIIDVRCGGRHVMALSRAGSVYTWGCNAHGELGLGHHNNQSSPRRPRRLGQCIAIEAGQFSSLALVAEERVVYRWGGGLTMPTKLDLTGNRIVAMAALFFDNLYLNDEGRLLIDYYQHGLFQLALGEPQRSVKMIIANRPGAFYVVVDECDEVYVLNRSMQQGYYQQTGVDYVTDVFENFATYSFGPREAYTTFMVYFVPKVSRSLDLRLDDLETADFYFELSGNEMERRRIYAHRNFLASVSSYLGNLLSENWEAEGLTNTTANYGSFYAYLRFLYTGVVNITNFDQLIELVTLATEHQEVKLLEVLGVHLMAYLNRDTCLQGLKLVLGCGLGKKVFRAIAKYWDRNLEYLTANGAIMEALTKKELTELMIVMRKRGKNKAKCIQFNYRAHLEQPGSRDEEVVLQHVCKELGLTFEH